MPFRFSVIGRRVVALLGVIGTLALAAVVASSPAVSQNAAGSGATYRNSAASSSVDYAAGATTLSTTNIASKAVSGTASVSLINTKFSPAKLTVTVGTRVTWTNQDNIAHTVTAGTREAPNGLFDAKLPNKGSTFSFVFTTPGTFNYFCRPHANMNAQIVVVPADEDEDIDTGTETVQSAAGSIDEDEETTTTVGPLTSTTLPKSPGVTAPVIGRASKGTQPRAEDIALIQGVRRADLWESVAGQDAATRASDPRVREIGRHIATEHTELDAKVREIAAKLNVDLPTEPNEDQQNWLRELQNAQGAQFDQIFIARLRFAHGGVFKSIAEVRANTPNDDVRAFATDANTIVLRHMTYLESSNLVDFSNVANASFNNANGASASSVNGGGSTILLVIGIAAVLILLVAFLFRGTMS